jgi:hypothetical protein
VEICLLSICFAMHGMRCTSSARLAARAIMICEWLLNSHLRSQHSRVANSILQDHSIDCGTETHGGLSP